MKSAKGWWLELTKFMPERPELEEQFKQVYQEEGARLIGVGAFFAAGLFLVFWLWDAYTVNRFGGLFGGLQNVRIALGVGLLLVGWSAVAHRNWLVKHYTAVASVAFTVGILGAVLVAYTSRLGGSVAEIYWALTGSTSTAIVVGFGASKLPAKSSLVLTTMACATALGLGLSVAEINLAFMGRLTFHILAVNTICYLLRRQVEQKEILLFNRMEESKESARKQAELQEAAELAERERAVAVQANEAKARFLGNMSHEIRSPLHGIVKVMEMSKPETSAATQKMIDMGLASARTLLSVVNGILDLSAANKGRLNVSEERIDLHSIANQVGDLHHASAATKGISLTISVTADVRSRTLMGSRVSLLKVVNNLVSNGIKFTDRGEVSLDLGSVHTGNGKAEVTVEVRDTGIGIRKEDLGKLGTPFWQEDQSLTKAQMGSGLGLAMTKEIAERLGGKLEIDSVKNVGTRAIVKIEMKVADDDIETEVVEKSSGDRSNVTNEPVRGSQEEAVKVAGTARTDRETAGRLHILLAEDNPLNMQVALKELDSLGMSVEGVSNGREALEAFKRDSFDLILMDCQMPVMDGLEASRAIRVVEHVRGRGERTPIVGWTAHRDWPSLQECEAAGMDDVLRKPTEKVELERAIAQWTVQEEQTEGST